MLDNEYFKDAFCARYWGMRNLRLAPSSPSIAPAAANPTSRRMLLHHADMKGTRKLVRQIRKIYTHHWSNITACAGLRRFGSSANPMLFKEVLKSLMESGLQARSSCLGCWNSKNLSMMLISMWWLLCCWGEGLPEKGWNTVVLITLLVKHRHVALARHKCCYKK